MALTKRPAAEAAPAYLVCLMGHSGPHGVVRDGDRVRADHPAVAANPSWFADPDLDAETLHRRRLALTYPPLPPAPPKAPAKPVARYRAKESFSIAMPPDGSGFSGGILTVGKGDVVAATHLLVKAYPGKFEKEK